MSMQYWQTHSHLQTDTTGTENNTTFTVALQVVGDKHIKKTKKVSLHNKFCNGIHNEERQAKTFMEKQVEQAADWHAVRWRKA